MSYAFGFVMNKKAAVFGSAGQLGAELVRELTSRGYEVTGWDRQQVDITDGRRVEQALVDLDPAVVFNAVAYNQVDVAEEEPRAAYEVNALAVRHIAVVCRQIDARLVHFSTDYVFDGRAGRPYTETDATHPTGAYAVSKLAGELYAQAYLEEALIVRTSGVYGTGALRTARGNFVELMLRLAQSRQPIRAVEDHIGSPTFAPLLAGRTVDLVERKLGGVFHIGGGTPISWYEWARMIFRKAGMDVKVTAATSRSYRTPAQRPKYSALSNAKMEGCGLEPMPPLETALERYLELRAAGV
jgi:dTDP-4-dehydrorhamnose reductase